MKTKSLTQRGMTQSQFFKKHGHHYAACCLMGRCGKTAREDGWAVEHLRLKTERLNRERATRNLQPTT
jgi:hypothetical protein